MSDKAEKDTKESAVDTKKKMAAVDLGLLEEDDEFEEFPAEEWDRKDEDSTDVNVWEDNWDDDTVEDDFSIQLSKFGRKRSMTHSPPMRSPEPVAKKICSRPTPMAAVVTPTSVPYKNGVAAAVDSNGDSQDKTPSPSTTRNGSTTRRTSSRNASSTAAEAPTPPSRTPTRSSARLRKK